MKTINRYLILALLAFVVLSTVNCAKKSNSSGVSRSSITSSTTIPTTSTTTTTTNNTTATDTTLASLEMTCQGRCAPGKVEYQNYCLPTKVYNCGSCYGFAYATDGNPYCYLSTAYPH